VSSVLSYSLGPWTVTVSCESRFKIMPQKHISHIIDSPPKLLDHMYLARAPN
jgi:hypothetical protein